MIAPEVSHPCTPKTPSQCELPRAGQIGISVVLANGVPFRFNLRLFLVGYSRPESVVLEKVLTANES